MEESVTVEHGDGDKKEVVKFRLINRKLPMMTVAQWFMLKNVTVNGVVEPVDGTGFTLSPFDPDEVLVIQGTPVVGTLASLPLSFAAAFCSYCFYSGFIVVILLFLFVGCNAPP